MQQILHAIALGKDFAVVESIDEQFFGGRLEAAKEMAGHANATNGEFQSSGEEKINQTKADRVSCATVNYPV